MRTILFLILAVLVLYVGKVKGFGRKILFNFLSALGVLVLLSILGEYVGLNIAVNLAGVLLIAFLGLPGIGLLGALHFLLV